MFNPSNICLYSVTFKQKKKATPLDKKKKNRPFADNIAIVVGIGIVPDLITTAAF